MFEPVKQLQKERSKLCLHCSADLVPTARFCSFCGSAQATKESRRDPLAETALPPISTSERRVICPAVWCFFYAFAYLSTRSAGYALEGLISFQIRLFLFATLALFVCLSEFAILWVGLRKLYLLGSFDPKVPKAVFATVWVVFMVFPTVYRSVNDMKTNRPAALDAMVGILLKG